MSFSFEEGNIIHKLHKPDFNFCCINNSRSLAWWFPGSTPNNLLTYFSAMLQSYKLKKKERNLIKVKVKIKLL